MSSDKHPTERPYLKQIDGLRAIAVCMVIFSHWPGYHQNIWSDDVFWFNGEIGVQLFFIISGFLITGILIEVRQSAEITGCSKSRALMSFYARRFLRIFPLFYATLFIGFILGHPDIRQSIHWHITYLSNFFFAARGEYLGDVSHFWSLAVEEQFYLVWPFLILFLPKRLLIPFITFCIFVAPIFRYFTSFIFNINDVAVNVLPISSLDSLAIGSLVAVVQRDTESGNRERILRKLMGISIFCAFSYLVVWSLVPIPEALKSHVLFILRALLIPALLGTVWQSSKGIKGPVGALLQSGPFSYVGKISYGIYVFHFFIPGITSWMCYALDFLIWEQFGILPYLFLNVSVLLLLSAISWHFFESKINNLKKYFPYMGAEKKSTPAVPALSQAVYDPYHLRNNKLSDIH